MCSRLRGIERSAAGHNPTKSAPGGQKRAAAIFLDRLLDDGSGRAGSCERDFRW